MLCWRRSNVADQYRDKSPLQLPYPSCLRRFSDHFHVSSLEPSYRLIMVAPPSTGSSPKAMAMGDKVDLTPRQLAFLSVCFLQRLLLHQVKRIINMFPCYWFNSSSLLLSEFADYRRSMESHLLYFSLNLLIVGGQLNAMQRCYLSCGHSHPRVALRGRLE